jgi:hypothetical protein
MAAMQALLRHCPGHEGATPELKRSTLRVGEEKSAEINFKALYKKTETLRPPHLDQATFVGPIIVKNSPGRGQGLFTTKDVQAGDLLLCEKALAHCYATPPEETAENSSTVSILINTHSDRITIRTQSDLITKIVQKLYKNPSLLPKFRELHCGSYELADVSTCDDEPVIDT